MIVAPSRYIFCHKVAPQFCCIVGKDRLLSTCCSFFRTISVFFKNKNRQRWLNRVTLPDKSDRRVHLEGDGAPEHQPRYCTVCGCLKPTAEMEVVFSTAFYRQGHVSYRLGICKLCSRRARSRTDKSISKGPSTCLGYESATSGTPRIHETVLW